MSRSAASDSVRKLRICCYARVKTPDVFEFHEFYKTDIASLRSLGHEVTVVSTVAALLRQRADVYYAWWFGYGIIPAVIGRLRRTPVVVSGVVHTLACRGLAGWPLHKRLLMMLTMRLADRSLFPSEGDFRRLGSFTPRNPEVVPLAIDLDQYRFSDEPREKFILIVTQLTRQNVQRKMVLESIQAFARFASEHDDYELIICGPPGDGSEVVAAEITRSGVEEKVHLQGRVSMEEKVRMMQRAWVYLQPTTCEGFGMAIGESLACGTPVITTPEVCVAAVYGDAVLYGRTPDDFAAQLTYLARQPDLYDALKQRGRTQVQQYSVAVRTERLRTIINSVVCSQVETNRSFDSADRHKSA